MSVNFESDARFKIQKLGLDASSVIHQQGDSGKLFELSEPQILSVLISKWDDDTNHKV